MHGSRSKIPSKKYHQAALREGIFNCRVKGLKVVTNWKGNYYSNITLPIKNKVLFTKISSHACTFYCETTVQNTGIDLGFG
jgi:hypothetical protein